MLDWLRLLGSVVDLPERQFDAATALSGSGPAFIALVVEAFEDAGIVSGLTHAKARELILTTMTGTAALLSETDLACSTLRRMVMSPGGTSAAGLAQMERAGVRGAIIDGVLAAIGAPASSDRRRPLSRSELRELRAGPVAGLHDHDLRVHRARAPAHPVQLAHRPRPRVPRPDGVAVPEPVPALIPSVGMFDLSPMVGLIVLWVETEVVTNLIRG